MKINFNFDKLGIIASEIQRAIKNTKFENHVFLAKESVRNFLLKQPLDKVQLCIDLNNGGIEFSRWICEEFGCKNNINPKIINIDNTVHFNITTINKISDITIECQQTQKINISTNKKEFSDLKSDAEYTDVTINSLYINLSTNELIDPTNKGMHDLNNHLIRSNKPQILFDHCPLKMLQIIRLATQLQWDIEKYTWFGIILNINKIALLSQDNIAEEFNQILLANKPSIGINRLLKSGILKLILYDIYSLKGLKQGKQHFGDVYEHTLSVIDNTKPILNHRWAGLLHDIGKSKTQVVVNSDIVHFYKHETEGLMTAYHILKNYKIGLKDIKEIGFAIKHHMFFKQSPKPSIKRIKKFMTINPDYNDIMLDIMHADNLSHSPQYSMPNQIPFVRQQIEHLNNTIKKSCPINGNDIQNALNIKPSAEIGNLLKKASDFYQLHPTASKEEIIQFIKNDETTN